MLRFVLVVAVLVLAGGAAAYFGLAEPRLRPSQPAYRVELTEADVKLDGKFVHPLHDGDVPAKARAQGASYPLFDLAGKLIDEKKLRPNAYHVVEFRAAPKNTYRVIRRLLLSLQQLEVLEVHFLEDSSSCGGAVAAALPILMSSPDEARKGAKGKLLEVALAKESFSAGLTAWPNDLTLPNAKPRGRIEKGEAFPYTQDGLNRFQAKANAWARSHDAIQVGLSVDDMDIPWSKARSVLCTLRKKSDFAPSLAVPGLITRLRQSPSPWRSVGPHAAVVDHGVILWDILL